MLQIRLGELGEGGGFFLNNLKNFMLSSDNVGSVGLTGSLAPHMSSPHPVPSSPGAGGELETFTLSVGATPGQSPISHLENTLKPVYN